MFRVRIWLLDGMNRKILKRRDTGVHSNRDNLLPTSILLIIIRLITKQPMPK